ncbi:Os01g0914200 [Oryza sativa Japonica Group]|uniref:Os01g0914200 protein n=1 Tax=Oryza sativa subsp. japonica TaxID=39947 RepID=C7IWU4_ORYSJ|nr:Os01g0914200 [Oryza sativa Japonica Group]|eukprot:NP_001172708.1 Os01g0914200 [Oryza sativa Japonica Group]
MPGICISLCHTMQTVLYSEKGSSGDCGDHQMAHLPGMHAHTG